MSIKYVIIPAAGYGTRVLPGSKSIPKEMFPVVSKPSIEYIIDEIDNINNIIIITSKNKSAILDHFDKNPNLDIILENKKSILEKTNKYNHLNLIDIRQKEQYGLGHAISLAKDIVCDNPFIVSLPDMLIKNGKFHMTKMIELYKIFNKGVIALMEVETKDIPLYGIVDGTNMKIDNDLFSITNLVEKPSIISAPSNLAIVGRYILPAKVMNYIEEDKICHLKTNSKDEIQLTCALNKLCIEDNGLIGYIIRSEINDIGSTYGFIKTNLSYGLDDLQYRDKLLKYIKTLDTN